MDIFYSSKSKLHNNILSFENDQRIEYVVDQLSKNYQNLFCVDDLDIVLDEEFKELVSAIKNRYLNIKTKNCSFCSYEQDIKNKNCEICFNVLDLTEFKYVKDIEGDTTYLTETSSEAIYYAFKTILLGIDHTIKTKKNSFLLIRPPGHHSDMETIQGFCLVNNIYIGTKYLREKYNLNKITILDWDVHHGNGTQKIFYEDPDVLFIDIHRYGKNFYPKTGKEDEIGSGKGVGFTLNISLDEKSDEKTYLNAFDTKILPKIDEFKTEIILVSCGFDAHEKDPFGGMLLKSESYYKFHKLLERFNVPIIYFLEGGYSKEVISECIHHMLS